MTLNRGSSSRQLSPGQFAANSHSFLRRSVLRVSKLNEIVSHGSSIEKDGGKLASRAELLRLGLKLTTERLETITSYDSLQKRTDGRYMMTSS